MVGFFDFLLTWFFINIVFGELYTRDIRNLGHRLVQ